MTGVFLDCSLPICLASQHALGTVGRDYGLLMGSEGLDSLPHTCMARTSSIKLSLLPTEAMFREQTGERVSFLFMKMKLQVLPLAPHAFQGMTLNWYVLSK